MLDVFFTTDVEIWCQGWDNIDAKFPASFRRCVHGPTLSGDYGLTYIALQLKEYGLKGVFFVESLVATRFGTEPLAEIVGLIQEHGQEAQLHLHTEWVNESRQPLLEGVNDRRRFLHDFSLAEQITLIGAAKTLIDKAGARGVTAFRGGNAAFNRDTLRALAGVRIGFDSSYDASGSGLASGVLPGIPLVEPLECDGVHEYPITVFHDGTGSLRHAQLTACSFRELESLLWQALKAKRKAFVILSHSFELLNKRMDQPDRAVVERFRKLCVFLDRHRDCFRVRGFGDLKPASVPSQPAPLRSPIWTTGARMVEQVVRWRYG